MVLGRKCSPIKHVDAFTCWMINRGNNAIDKPPVFSCNMKLEISDIFMHVYTLEEHESDVTQIWLLNESEDNERLWQQMRIPITDL